MAKEKIEASLYLLTDGEGRYKIGWTTNLKSRLRHYKTHSPKPLTVVFSFIAPEGETEARQIESDWKEKLKSYHSHGEWYNIPVRVVDELKEQAESFDINLW